MDKIVHFEIPGDDVERMKKFYSGAFGWQLEDFPEMQYVIARTVDVDDKRMPKEPGAINGGMMKRRSFVTAPSLTVNVENLEAAMERVTVAGGTLVGEKMEVGDMGRMHYFKDTEGNVMSLWEAKKK